MTCEAYSEYGDGRCMWCFQPKADHEAGDCPDCLGYGYVVVHGDEVLTADRGVDLDDPPDILTCKKCRGACFIGRDGGPAWVSHGPTFQEIVRGVEIGGRSEPF